MKKLGKITRNMNGEPPIGGQNNRAMRRIKNKKQPCTLTATPLAK